MKLSIHHHSPPDSGSNRQADHRLRASTCTKCPFPEGNCAHIIDQSNWQLHLLLNDCLKRNIQPLAGQIGQKLYDSRINIGSPWYANAHAFNITNWQPTRLGQLCDELNDPLDYGLLSLRSQSWTFALVEDLACLSICNRRTQVRSTKINTD